MLLWGSWQRGTSVSFRVSPDYRKKGQDWAAPLQAHGGAWLGTMLGAWAASEVQHLDTPS